MHQTVRDFRIGQETVGTAAQIALPELGIEVRRYVIIKAAVGNAGRVYVGRIGVTTGTGFELSAKEELKLEVDNTNPIYIIASVGNQKYSWVAQ